MRVTLELRSDELRPAVRAFLERDEEPDWSNVIASIQGRLQLQPGDVIVIKVDGRQVHPLHEVMLR